MVLDALWTHVLTALTAAGTIEKVSKMLATSSRIESFAGLCTSKLEARSNSMKSEGVMPSHDMTLIM
jgi:hypothetical protein